MRNGELCQSTTMRIHNICEKPIMSADCVLNSKLWQSLNTGKQQDIKVSITSLKFCVNNIYHPCSEINSV